MNGWICLHRKLLEWEWFDNSNVLHVFMFILLSTNHEDKKWHNELIKKGEFITSVKHISQKTKLSNQQVRSALNKLKSTNQITINTTNQYTRITVVNWELYQGITDDSNKQNNKQVNKQITNEQQTNNKQITTTKQYNNITNKDMGYINISSSAEPTLQSPQVPYLEIMALFNNICQRMPKIKFIKGERQKAVSARYKEYGIEGLQELFTRANESDFLNGASNKAWVADFDWLMRATSIPKVLEGKYDNKVFTATQKHNTYVNHIITEKESLGERNNRKADAFLNKHFGVGLHDTPTNNTVLDHDSIKLQQGDG